MNVFEDLVVELKQEKLLEDTVMETSNRSDAEPAANIYGVAIDSHEVHADLNSMADESDILEIRKESNTVPGSFGLADVEPPIVREPELPVAEAADLRLQGSEEVVEIRKPDSEKEFFKKRAVSEISSLQMVEAVLSSVERERMKIVPRSYDDLDAKKALHFFMHVTDGTNSDEHKKAEFDLLRETEAWCSALALRDKGITVANVRRYCENCKPMLSSQAMLALARFYRNLPHSESVRGKFDFIITRLFSRPHDDDKRMLLFTRDEMLGHIKTLYADWSSIPLYNADEDETNILLTALSFEELAIEAESAGNFDDLIKSDFFGRLRLFKESIAELFFAPVVTAAAIECNVRIGNVYVDLIDRERRKSDPASIHEKFGDLDDQTVSEAAGRTLELVSILRDRGKTPIPEVVEEDEPHVYEVPHHERTSASEPEFVSVRSARSGFVNRLKEQAASVNRYFLATAMILVLASFGIFVWGNYYSEPKVSTVGVKTLSFQGTDFGDMVKTAKLSGDTLYIVAQPTVEVMTKDKQTELLQKLYESGSEKGWVNVNLMNSEGRTIGYATQTRLELVTPTQSQ